MIHSIVKYEKHQLAALNTADLSHAVALHTTRMMANCRAAQKAWKEAANGEERRAALVRWEEANMKFDEYLDEQYALFESRGLPKTRAFKEAIIPTGETNAAGLEILRIVPREAPINPFDDKGDEPTKEDLRQMNDAPDFESDEAWERIDCD